MAPTPFLIKAHQALYRASSAGSLADSYDFKRPATNAMVGFGSSKHLLDGGLKTQLLFTLDGHVGKLMAEGLAKPPQGGAERRQGSRAYLPDKIISAALPHGDYEHVRQVAIWLSEAAITKGFTEAETSAFADFFAGRVGKLHPVEISDYSQVGQIADDFTNLRDDLYRRIERAGNVAEAFSGDALSRLKENYLLVAVYYSSLRAARIGAIFRHIESDLSSPDTVSSLSEMFGRPAG